MPPALRLGPTGYPVVRAKRSVVLHAWVAKCSMAATAVATASMVESEPPVEHSPLSTVVSRSATLICVFYYTLDHVR